MKSERVRFKVWIAEVQDFLWSKTLVAIIYAPIWHPSYVLSSQIKLKRDLPPIKNMIRPLANLSG